MPAKGWPHSAKNAPRLGPGNEALSFNVYFSFIPTQSTMSIENATTRVGALAGKTGGFGSTLKFVFEEGIVYLDGTGEQTTVSNEDKTAQCTIGMKLSDFNDLLDGSLNPMTAFMTGKFKIEGDMGVAMKLQSLFS